MIEEAYLPPSLLLDPSRPLRVTVADVSAPHLTLKVVDEVVPAVIKWVKLIGRGELATLSKLQVVANASAVES